MQTTTGSPFKKKQKQKPLCPPKAAGRLSITGDAMMSSGSGVPSGRCAAEPIHLPSDAHKQSVNIPARADAMLAG